MSEQASNNPSLADDIIEQIDHLLAEAERETKPLEVDPYRDQLFQLFVTAEGAGLVDEESEPDLTADGLCRSLAVRWGLDHATQQSVQQQSQLPPESLAKMRMLWSLMRMWMEWTYAWQRWPEFHDEADG